MSADAPILIYCRWEAAGGIERVSLRLRDFLRRNGVAAELVSREGHPVFGAEVRRLAETDLGGRTLVFSRKRDLMHIGWRGLGARLVYWRHVPLVGPMTKRLMDAAFIVAMSWRAPVLCVCDELAEHLARLPLLRRAALAVAYAPVAPDVPATMPIRRTDQPKNLLYVGRPGAQKRLDKVLAVVAEARDAGHPVRLRVHGYPPPKDQPDGVTFAPLGSDPQASFSEADALIVWSEYEGFPTIMVEAARAGLPIIANAFATGLRDFERRIGPPARIEDRPEALMRVFTRLPRGSYDLSGVRDEALWPVWAKVLGVSMRDECSKNDIPPRDNAGLRTSDV
ncbi:MAG: glycosyltransferase [Maritimibacter sp.]|uniref:glycosyltransferase n=1 Tax=Maritimibacter sp. TaxID=2003363 RepID=UPI001D2EC3E6|nr:glycosyltransferase [Maritimibacter sp.]MBL6429092.1 glycosyltransferase [Maritimibacter sp.]